MLDLERIKFWVLIFSRPDIRPLVTSVRGRETGMSRGLIFDSQPRHISTGTKGWDVTNGAG